MMCLDIEEYRDAKRLVVYDDLNNDCITDVVFFKEDLKGFGIFLYNYCLAYLKNRYNVKKELVLKINNNLYDN